jgi:hypothetical protein
MKSILTKFSKSCLGSGRHGWGVQTEHVGEANKVYVSVTETGSKWDPFYLLQYEINKFSWIISNYLHNPNAFSHVSYLSMFNSFFSFYISLSLFLARLCRFLWFRLPRCQTSFLIGEGNQLMLKSVVSNLLCSLNPRHVSAFKCHPQQMTTPSEQ